MRRNLRWLLATACAAVLIAVFAAFDSFGADCGDAIKADGSQSFECNTAAYVVMAAGFVAAAGLVAMVVRAAIEWLIARRERPL
jgi:hypothetical protein